MNFFAKCRRALSSRRLLSALARHRVLAGTEHRYVLTRGLNTIIDIGANRGQFALAAREYCPKASIISFEPLSKAASVYRQVFSNDARVTLHQVAIGPFEQIKRMHVSAREDSSSLLPISAAQVANFPGTGEVGTLDVSVAPLEKYIPHSDLVRPVLLKLDVQGFEFEALLGCASLLDQVDVLYCECSFVELYAGQKLAFDIIDWLSQKGFQLTGIYNPLYGKSGETLQADFMFKSNSTKTD
jgi:FkbM family methyltransferase